MEEFTAKREREVLRDMERRHKLENIELEKKWEQYLKAKEKELDILKEELQKLRVSGNEKAYNKKALQVKKLEDELLIIKKEIETYKKR